MISPTIIIIGAGGHAKACIDVVEQQGQFVISGLIGTKDEIGRELFGYRILATDEGLKQLADNHRHALVAVGQIKSPDQRIRLFGLAQEFGYLLPVIISPSAYVSRHASVAVGTIVMHNAIINAGAQIGKNCIINSRALVEHGAVVGDNCHLSTGAIINGDARVGAGSFVGSGSVIKEGVSLGHRCVIGMSVCVRHHQADRARFIG